MEDNINKMIIKEGTTFSRSWLNVLLYMGLIGAVMTILPVVLTIDNGLPSESIIAIGDFLTTVAEIGFISLIAFKLYKDGVNKPSYVLLICYAGVMALDMLVEFLSEEIGFVMSIITIIFSVIMGFILLLAPTTKKIGVWLLLSLAGIIILLSIVSDDFENSNKLFGILLTMLYLFPFTKYMESCQKFLIGSRSQDNSDDNDLLKKYEIYKAEQMKKDNN